MSQYIAVFHSFKGWKIFNSNQVNESLEFKKDKGLNIGISFDAIINAGNPEEALKIAKEKYKYKAIYANIDDWKKRELLMSFKNGNLNSNNKNSDSNSDDE